VERDRARLCNQAGSSAAFELVAKKRGCEHNEASIIQFQRTCCADRGPAGDMVMAYQQQLDKTDYAT
jgi:hypothetical protein